MSKDILLGILYLYLYELFIFYSVTCDRLNFDQYLPYTNRISNVTLFHTISFPGQ